MELTKKQIAYLYNLHINQRCKVRAGRVFHPNRHSLNEAGDLIFSPSLMADCHEGTFDYTDFDLLMHPLSAITDRHLVQMAFLTEPRAEWEVNYVNREKGLRVINDKAGKTHWITTGDSLEEFFYEHEVQACCKPLSHLALQYLHLKGYALPLFIEEGHPLNGKTILELNLAKELTP